MAEVEIMLFLLYNYSYELEIMGSTWGCPPPLKHSYNCIIYWVVNKRLGESPGPVPPKHSYNCIIYWAMYKRLGEAPGQTPHL